MENVRTVSPKLKELLIPAVYEELMKLPMDGQAEIRLVNPKRTGRITLRDYEYLGQRRFLYNQHGVERVVPITKKMTLDFRKLDDCLVYVHAKYHLTYAGGNTPIIKVVNINEQAIENVRLKDIESEVNGYISQLKGQDIFNFARVLLIPVRAGSNEAIVKSMIYTKASEDPDGVLAEITSPERFVKEVFFAAKSKGMISDPAGTWYFKTEKIGVTQDQALNWLSNNQDLIPSILREIDVNITQGSMAKKSNPVTPSEEGEFDEYVKMGDEYMKENDFQNALECFENALLIKKVAAITKKRNAAEKKLKESVTAE